MRCIIVRHGKAEQASGSGRDEDRALKARGIRQAEYLASWFSEPGRSPALILASRFERAICTARIIQQTVGAPLELTPLLEVGHPPSVAVELLTVHRARNSVMLVGHNPQLSELIWVLTRGAPAEEAGLRTGEAVVLECDPAALIGSAREMERIRLDGDD